MRLGSDAHKISGQWYFESNANYESLLRFRRKHVSFRKIAAQCTLQIENADYDLAAEISQLKCFLSARRYAGASSWGMFHGTVEWRNTLGQEESRNGDCRRGSRLFFVFAVIVALDVVHFCFSSQARFDVE
jgi:hypothetical protein